MLSTTSKILTTFFPIWMHLISLYCLIAMSRTSNTIYNSYGKSRQPCLVPDLRGKAIYFSPLSTILAVGLWHMTLVMLWEGPSIPILLTVWFYSIFYNNIFYIQIHIQYNMFTNNKLSQFIIFWWVGKVLSLYLNDPCLFLGIA